MSSPSTTVVSVHQGAPLPVRLRRWHATPSPSALGFEQVDLLGLSLGGFVAQIIVQQEPRLVRKIFLAGTGPAGGTGIDKVTLVTIFDMIRAALAFKDPKNYLFFTQTPTARRRRASSCSD